MHLDIGRFTGDDRIVLAPCAIALGATLAVEPASAPAAPLVVGGDGACLTPEGVAARTRAWAPEIRWPDDVVVTVDHRGTDLRIELVGPTGERIERAFADVPSECHDVELMAAVAVAMALDAYAQIPAPTEARPAAPPSDVPTRSERTPDTSTTTTREVATRTRSPAIELALAGGGGFGVVPFATGELAFGVRLQWRRVWWVGDVETSLRIVNEFDDDDGRLGLVRIAVASGVCSPWSRGRWTAALCGLFAGGSMGARARDTAAPRGEWVPWVAGLLRTEVGVALGSRWTLAARTDLVIGIVRPAVGATRDGAQELWDTPNFGFRGALVVGARIGGPVKQKAGRRMEGTQ